MPPRRRIHRAPIAYPAIGLYRRACAEYNGSCHNLFRFGLFDETPIRKEEGDPIGCCASAPTNDKGRVFNVYQCALASLKEAQQGKPEQARAHLERACKERAWLGEQRTSTCKDPKTSEEIWGCVDVEVALDAAGYACAKLK